MADREHNSKSASIFEEEERAELFRRAARVAKDARMLIRETEELLAQTRRILQHSNPRLAAK